MEYLSIIGIGAITNLGNDVNIIWQNLVNDHEIPNIAEMIPFESGLSLSQKRRSNRYSEMGVYISKMAIINAGIDINMVDKKRVGTIFTTGYGPIVSSLEFSKSVIQGDSEFCSPALFANSVNNACVGHICMLLGLKGVSTVLMGSNNLEYSQMLMKKGDTDLILTGSIEEYCKELKNSFALGEYSKNLFIKEGAISLLVTKDRDKSLAYCDLIDFAECNLGGYPLTAKIDEKKAATKISNMVSELVDKYEIDAFFSSCNGSYFDEIELTAIKKIFNKDITYVNNIKKLFGETLGSAFNLNIMVGALCIKNGKLPLKLDLAQNKTKNIMISGYDISGSYMLGVIKRK